MNDEMLFRMAVKITAAQITAHCSPPGSPGGDDWAEHQVEYWWARLRHVWREGRSTDNVHPFPGAD